MDKRILSVSYDESLLITRRMLLEREGYTVVSALGFVQATARCKEGGFDLFILGHSISQRDKQELIKIFHGACVAPILCLQRYSEINAPGAEYQAGADDPREFLQAVAAIFSERSAAHAE